VDAFFNAVQSATGLDRAILDFLPYRLDRPLLGALTLDLYHGTPSAEIDGMLSCGIEPQTHSILGGDWFCVSPNDNVLRLFSEESGDSGLAANSVPLPTCLFLGAIHASFVIGTATSDPDEDTRAEVEAWFEARGFDANAIADDDLASAWQHLPEGLDAFVWPCCYKHLRPDGSWSGPARSEAEIALTHSGCRRFQASLDQVVRQNEWSDVVRLAPMAA